MMKLELHAGIPSPVEWKGDFLIDVFSITNFRICPHKYLEF